MRVACEKKRGLSFYEQVEKEVSEKDKTKKPVLAIVKNEPTYVSDPAMADLTYAVEPTYSVAKMLITASVIRCARYYRVGSAMHLSLRLHLQAQGEVAQEGTEADETHVESVIVCCAFVSHALSSEVCIQTLV